MTRFPVVSMKRIPDVPLTGLSLLATQTAICSGNFWNHIPTYRLPEVEFPGVKKPRANERNIVKRTILVKMLVCLPMFSVCCCLHSTVASFGELPHIYQLSIPSNASIPPSLIFALAYAVQEQFFQTELLHIPSIQWLLFTSAVSVSGIFMLSSLANPSPLWPHLCVIPLAPISSISHAPFLARLRLEPGETFAGKPVRFWALQTLKEPQ
nr:hypothetical protein KK1_037827 [Ipomoea batatas]